MTQGNGRKPGEGVPENETPSPEKGNYDKAGDVGEGDEPESKRPEPGDGD